MPRCSSTGAAQEGGRISAGGHLGCCNTTLTAQPESFQAFERQWLLWQQEQHELPTISCNYPCSQLRAKHRQPHAGASTLEAAPCMQLSRKSGGHRSEHPNSQLTCGDVPAEVFCGHAEAPQRGERLVACHGGLL